MGRRAELANSQAWRVFAAQQFGMIARRQLIGLGLTPAQAVQWVRCGRWRQVLPGVYATFTGPLPDRARLWAAVLYAGPGSVLTGMSGLWLSGALDGPLLMPIQVMVPARRCVLSIPGLQITRSRLHTENDRTRGSPPARSIEDCALDACDDAVRPDPVLDLVFRVCQRRLTTPGRLAAVLTQRTRHRWRALIGELLEEAADGVASTLERRYLRDVERAHGLPRGRRNHSEIDSSNGSSVYRDVRYEQWQTVVELDGRGAHPDETHFRDLRRDNRIAITDHRSLRYGWHDVVTQPCAVAAQVITLLRAQGWDGVPHMCGSTCTVR